MLVGDSARLRFAAAGVAAAALLVGSARVAALDRRSLAPGHVHGAVVVVTGQPSGSRGLAAVTGVGETVVLSAPGILLEEGGIYRVDGRYEPLDPVVRDYYATQGAHLELRATDAVRTGRRGGVWGLADSLHRAALRHLGVGADPAPPRALVAGIALGDIGGLPAETRAELRSSGLYHLVAVSGQNVALVIAFTLVCLGAVGVIGVPARVAGLGVTVAYVLVTGAGPSIVRAGVAGVLVAVAWLGSRVVSRWHLLACGAVVVLGLESARAVRSGLSALVLGGARDLRRRAAAAGRARSGGGGVGGVHGGDGSDRVVALRPGEPAGGAGEPAGTTGGGADPVAGAGGDAWRTRCGRRWPCRCSTWPTCSSGYVLAVAAACS